MIDLLDIFLIVRSELAIGSQPGTNDVQYCILVPQRRQWRTCCNDQCSGWEKADWRFSYFRYTVVFLIFGRVQACTSLSGAAVDFLRHGEKDLELANLAE